MTINLNGRLKFCMSACLVFDPEVRKTSNCMISVNCTPMGLINTNIRCHRVHSTSLWQSILSWLLYNVTIFWLSRIYESFPQNWSHCNFAFDICLNHAVISVHTMDRSGGTLSSSRDATPMPPPSVHGVPVTAPPLQPGAGGTLRGHGTRSASRNAYSHTVISEMFSIFWHTRIFVILQVFRNTKIKN